MKIKITSTKDKQSYRTNKWTKEFCITAHNLNRNDTKMHIQHHSMWQQTENKIQKELSYNGFQMSHWVIIIQTQISNSYGYLPAKRETTFTMSTRYMNDSNSFKCHSNNNEKNDINSFHICICCTYTKSELPWNSEQNKQFHNTLLDAKPTCKQEKKNLLFWCK